MQKHTEQKLHFKQPLNLEWGGVPWECTFEILSVGRPLVDTLSTRSSEVRVVKNHCHFLVVESHVQQLKLSVIKRKNILGILYKLYPPPLPQLFCTCNSLLKQNDVGTECPFKHVSFDLVIPLLSVDLCAIYNLDQIILWMKCF